MTKSFGGKSNFSYFSLLIYSAVLGLFAGCITVLFILLFQLVQKFLWTSLPDQLGINTSHNAFPVVVCAIGGLLVGVSIYFLGNYPATIEEAIEKYKATKAFDYKHIWQALVVSIISLGFGAALGPEAALTSIIGGFITLIGIKLHKAEIIRYGAEIDKKLNRPKRIILGLVATFTGYLVARPFGDNGYFNLDLAPYNLKLTDLGWVLIVAIIGAIIGLIYALVDGAMENAFKNLRTKRTILLALFGGVGLGLLATYQPLVLFSGHEGIRTISTSFSSQPASFFLIASLLKVLAACICLATGWKGGRFFPLMFAGAAVGLFLARLLPIPETLALSVGMSATLSYVLRKPIVAAVLLFLFFPINLYIPIVLSAFIASKLATQTSSLIKQPTS